MAQTEEQLAREGDVVEMDSLLRERTSRKITSNGDGTRRSSLNRDYLDYLGVGAGDEIQLMFSAGLAPILVDEACIIIRPWSEEP